MLRARPGLATNETGALEGKDHRFGKPVHGVLSREDISRQPCLDQCAQAIQTRSHVSDTRDQPDAHSGAEHSTWSHQIANERTQSLATDVPDLHPRAVCQLNLDPGSPRGQPTCLDRTARCMTPRQLRNAHRQNHGFRGPSRRACLEFAALVLSSPRKQLIGVDAVPPRDHRHGHVRQRLLNDLKLLLNVTVWRSHLPERRSVHG
jgi:hypothetical protein